MSKVSKFEKQMRMSSDKIRGQRAKFVAEDAKEAQTELVNNIKKRKRNLERELMQLEDTHRDSKLSLNVVNDRFDAHNWVEDIQCVKIQLANVEIELKIAEGTTNEWFVEKEWDENK